MTAPAVLGALTPPAPTWLGLDANSLWTALTRLSDEHRTGILERLIADAVEMRGAQAECADLADQRDTLAIELADHRARDLAGRLARYLQIRQHTLSTIHLPFLAKIRGEADYVHGEAEELRDAVYNLSDALHVAEPDLSREKRERAHVRHEIADVVLATTCLAGFLGVTVEDCIDEKTELDRGRG